MSIDENIAKESKGLLSRVLGKVRKTVSRVYDGAAHAVNNAKYATISAAVLAVLAASPKANAAVLPTDDLPLSSPVAYTINRPEGAVWKYTGGTYDITDPTKLIVSSDDGMLEFYSIATDGSGNVTGANLLGSMFSGISGLQDIVAAPGGYIGVAQNNIFLLDKDFSNGYTIDIGDMDITDVHVYTTLDESVNVPGLGYAIMFSTLNDGIRRLTSTDGDSVLVKNISTYSIGGLDLDRDVYSNNLFINKGDDFVNMNDNGELFGSGYFVNMNNSTIIKGDAFGNGYFAEIQNSRIQLHNTLLVQDSQIFISEQPVELTMSIIQDGPTIDDYIPGNPGCEFLTQYGVTNTTEVDNLEYGLAKVVLPSGSIQGVCFAAAPESWSYAIDPNEIVFTTTTPTAYIQPNGGTGLFELYAKPVELKQKNANGFTALNEEFEPVPVYAPDYVYPKTLQSDINNNGGGDGIVDILDLSILTEEWLTPGVYANFNGDDMVNLEDFSIMAKEWLKTEPWYDNLFSSVIVSPTILPQSSFMGLEKYLEPKYLNPCIQNSLRKAA